MKKAFLIIALVLTLILSVFSYVSAESIPGDMNGDGVIDVKDGVLIHQYLAGWDVKIDDLAAADCYCDGSINAKDAVLFAQYMVGWNVKLG